MFKYWLTTREDGPKLDKKTAECLWKYVTRQELLFANKMGCEDGLSDIMMGYEEWVGGFGG